MKLLVNRTPGYQTADFVPYQNWGQWLEYDDGSREFDLAFTQASAIIQAECYSGRAAKDDDGNWVPAPGPRKHDYEVDILGFRVGLTFERMTSDGKSVFDYSVTTPTGVSFHGNRKDNTLIVPGHWSLEHNAAELLTYICLGEDSGAEFPEDTTPEQWQWIRSDEREMSSANIDDLIERMERGTMPLVEALAAMGFDNEAPASKPQTSKEFLLSLTDMGEEWKADKDKDAEIQERAKHYLDTLVYYNQSSLVEYLLEKGDLVSLDDIDNLYPNTGDMDASELAEFLDDEMGVNWKDLIDIHDYISIEDEADEEVDLDAERANLDVRDLHDWDLELLREHITENHEPREIFQWWLVDEWLAKELKALGHPTLTDDSSFWWGRRTCGQALIDDSTLQAVAKKYV